MKITALVTVSPRDEWRPVAPFVLVYDVFKPEDAVEAIRGHVGDRARLPGYDAQWTAVRHARTATVVLSGRSMVGAAVDVQVLVADVQFLSRYTRSVSCPSCEATWLWSAFGRPFEGEPAAVREAVAVGCDECGWIASDHPVAGHPSVPELTDGLGSAAVTG